MTSFAIEPEVAGGFGNRTIIDTSSGRRKVIKLHYQFDGWLGDALLETTPCYIVSEPLASDIVGQGLTGYEFDDVVISTSDEFSELYPDVVLPAFRWLKIVGIPCEDDFGLTPNLSLVVSERALHVLQSHGISNAASVIPYP